MAQHDYVIDNQAGAAFRSDLNAALAAIVGLNSGASAPSTTFGNMLWIDTTASLAKKRNNANAAWQTFASKDFDVWLLGDGAVGAPAYSFSADPDTGIYRIGANNIGVAANGAKVLDIGTGGLDITGALTLSSTITLVNNVALKSKDSGGTARSVVIVDGSNAMAVGDVGNAMTGSVLQLLAKTSVDTYVNNVKVGLYDGNGLVVRPTVATPAGGDTSLGIGLGVARISWYIGSGVPTITAAQGSAYLRVDGGAGTWLYRNNNGSTGWTAVA